MNRRSILKSMFAGGLSWFGSSAAKAVAEPVDYIYINGKKFLLQNCNWSTGNGSQFSVCDYTFLGSEGIAL